MSFEYLKSVMSVYNGNNVSIYYTKKGQKNEVCVLSMSTGQALTD